MIKKHGHHQNHDTDLLRIELDLKEALRTAAERDHRSIANMVEVTIREYCGRVGIAIPVSIAEADKLKKPAKNKK